MATTTKAPAATHAPAERSREIEATVTRIIADVAERGDAAVQKWSARLDRWERKSFRLDEAEIERIVASVPWPVLEDIRFSQAQVRRFAEAQRAAILDVELETFPGVTLGHRNIPIASSDRMNSLTPSRPSTRSHTVSSRRSSIARSKNGQHLCSAETHCPSSDNVSA